MGTIGIIAVACASALVSGCIVYLVMRSGKTGNPVNPDKTTVKDPTTKTIIKHFNDKEVETINRELDFTEIVAWFKSLKLVLGKDIPFIANPLKIRDLIPNTPISENAIFVGVYNLEKDVITNAKLINATSLDAKTKEILGEEPLIVLQ